MEDFFLSNGLSWTMSKILPYLIFLLVGFLLVVILRKLIVFRLPILVKLIWLLSLVPLAIYFAVNPIYQGDFSNDEIIYTPSGIVELEKGRLTVLAIPGCPYCYEAVDLVGKIHERTVNEPIDFIVYTSISDNLRWYQEKGGNGIQTRMQQTKTELFEKSGGTFPAFAYFDGKDVYLWKNDSFGTKARDWVEKQIGRASSYR